MPEPTNCRSICATAHGSSSRGGDKLVRMRKLNPAEMLAEYERAALGLLAQSNKDVLGRAAHLLASYVAHYQLQHGIIPSGALVDVTSANPNVRQPVARAETLRVLAAALTLATVMNVRPPRPSPIRKERPKRSPGSKPTRSHVK